MCKQVYPFYWFCNDFLSSAMKSFFACIFVWDASVNRLQKAVHGMISRQGFDTGVLSLLLLYGTFGGTVVFTGYADLLIR